MKESELVQVVIPPAHRILDSHVQVPKRVRPGNLNSPPDQRVRLRKDDKKLQRVLRPMRRLTLTG